MKKTTFLILAFLILTTGARAQSRPTSALYAAPARVFLPGDEDEKKEPAPSILLREHFYPIGWSRDGKFAYYTEPPDEACGCYFAEIYIQDMRTDKILWSRHYNSEDDEKNPQTLAAYWKKNRKEISAKLAAYKIVPAKFALERFPFEMSGDTLNADLQVDLKNVEDLASTGTIKLDLVSKASGRKTLYEQRYDADKYEGIRTATVAGLLPSPFEKRAAIVVVETYRGWEGPPHITSLRLVGASLAANFRRTESAR